MRNIILYTFLGAMALTQMSCSKKALCPAYMEPQKGTLSMQDKKMSADEIRAESKKLLDAQDSYITVKRDPRTGLVVGKRRVKKNKNNTNTDKSFRTDPRALKGVKGGN